MLLDGNDIFIGGTGYKIDQTAPQTIQRPAYSHYFRSLFSGRTDITGRPGSQNLNPDLMRWELTDFTGEGQRVLRAGDPDSSTRFWQSEGLDFKTLGQMSLNKSTILGSPDDSTGGATTTAEGAADMTDVTGTSTVVNVTDRRLNLASGPDIIGTSANHTPGASQAQADFYIYTEGGQLTTVQGNNLSVGYGSTQVSGTDMLMKARSSIFKQVIGTLTAGQNIVNYFLYTNGSACRATVSVTRSSGGISILATEQLTISNSAAPTSHSAQLTFTATATDTYYFNVTCDSIGTQAPTQLGVDKIGYGIAASPVTVTVSVRNQSAGSTVISKQLIVSNTTSAKVASLTYSAAAATNYRYRVQYDAGAQRPVVDKIAYHVGTAAAAGWSLDEVTIGQGGNVWLFGSRAGASIRAWTYNFSTESWTQRQDMSTTSATTSQAVIATASTGTFQYSLTDGGEVRKDTTAADVRYINAGIAGASGMAICQNRMFILVEDTTSPPVSGTDGVRIQTYDLDQATGTLQQSVVVANIVGVTDTSLHARMVGTPGGAVFFVNYDYQCVIYRADASGSTTVVAEVQRLDPGIKGTAIAYSGGYTYITGQYLAETGQTPISALFVVYPNGAPDRIGLARRVGGSSAPITDIQPFQNDLWMLQGKFVWRYSLVTGGLYLETQLNPFLETEARAIAVMSGHQFSAFRNENSTVGAVWTTGSVGTYRSASVAAGNTYTSSVYDFGLPGTTKILTGVRVISETLPANTSIVIQYQADSSGTFSTIGTHFVGSKTTFQPSNEVSAVTFETLQMRAILASEDGVSTPVCLGIVVEALPNEREEFFELTVLTSDQDSSFRSGDDMRSGGAMASALIALCDSGTPTTLIDGFAETAGTNAGTSYLVRVDDVFHSNDIPGEGRCSVKMRVLPN